MASDSEKTGTQLQGKVALVTGASSGIGRATALALSEAGLRVAVGARRTDRLSALEDSAPGEVLSLPIDVTSYDSVAQAVSQVVERFGRLDALVSNAGVMLNGLILDADIRQWHRMVDTNLLGSMYAVHAALPHIIQAKGHIVQVSSTSGRIASLGSGVYSATKFGVSAFTESLRQEVTTQGVRVTLIEPGFVATELTTHITDENSRRMASEIAQSMRTLQAADIAEAVLYALRQPEHVSVNSILIRPTDQVR
ncbi:SDR family oxidoreductase [Microbacterium kyungheense]|uniref:NADP-dependent 3-hydroxy acid dehydrogenase YdfG n=1 Tax=Microbacterium kyungheense TaxID=1263636 RepID=A0A543EUD7_9MICO|nr:SDR family NAD(P)-dependent oxidoreductase [Microbacterium kyungheense]TQM25187.1 NADP-dependent 3-hydroxy acid dehydrogenase YdfG [Microbacterium kyungheense]